jgi:HAD superfamily hydrolase (TIGR01509 family)
LFDRILSMVPVDRSGEIKAIAFDLGNVVLTSDYPYNTPQELKAFCDQFGVTMDNMETAFSVSFDPFSKGQTTEDQFWADYLYTARATNPDIAAAKVFYRNVQKENDQMLSLAQKLAPNYRLAILSTIPKEWLAFKNRKFGLDKLFNPIISSGHAGIAKPNPAIYRLLLDEIGLPGQNVLFIDDKRTTFPPAEAVGINTILFRGQRDLEANLRQRNIRGI